MREKLQTFIAQLVACKSLGCYCASIQNGPQMPACARCAPHCSSVRGGGIFGTWRGHEGSDLINRLILLWSHNLMDTGSQWKLKKQDTVRGSRALECALEGAILFCPLPIFLSWGKQLCPATFFLPCICASSQAKSNRVSWQWHDTYLWSHETK